MKQQIVELLKIADMLDERGATREANEIVGILQYIADQKRTTKIASILIELADKLDAKGAIKEAQLADQLLQEIPQAFRTHAPDNFVAPERSEINTPNAPNTPVEIPVQTQVVDQAPVEQTQETTELVDREQVVEESATEGTPFSALEDDKEVADSQDQEDKGPTDPVIEQPKDEEPGVDYLSLEDFESLIDSMKYRHSQGPKRQVYEQVLERAQKAQEYKAAYEEWLDYAHQLFGDEPIRLQI